jgi:hypothetical protein
MATIISCGQVFEVQGCVCVCGSPVCYRTALFINHTAPTKLLEETTGSISAAANLLHR